MLGYNNYNNNEVTDLDVIFMYKSEAFREIMELNILEHKKNLLKSNDVKSLFNSTLSSIATNKQEFNDEVRKNIIEELLKILSKNTSNIGINISDLDDGDINFLNKKIKIDNIYKNENDNQALYCVVKKYVNFDKYNIDDIISVFLRLSEKSVYNNECLSGNLVQYKIIIFDHIRIE